MPDTEVCPDLSQADRVALLTQKIQWLARRVGSISDKLAGIDTGTGISDEIIDRNKDLLGEVASELETTLRKLCTDVARRDGLSECDVQILRQVMEMHPKDLENPIREEMNRLRERDDD